MVFSLYDATVANYLQILGAVGGFLEKSLTHFQEKGIDPTEIVQSRLTHDMQPLRLSVEKFSGYDQLPLPFGTTDVS